MALDAGTRLGTYEIVGALGAGGMGEVYRARDTKLGREVAVKVLPEEFARDRDRLARFEREAKLLAALNHRGIATLYGLEESEGQPFLVMELVEGETLAERIARGPLPLPEALRLFRQIAEALDSAHLQGIVHRDLKPANVKITPRDEIKLLDFGLAKALEPEVTSSNLSDSPTLERNETRDGAVLGTAAYMSPEQARGRSVDKRTDVWAFGCCLYEVLTGRQAFGGETLSDTLSAVLRDEPGWNALPAASRSLVRHCLEKDPFRRLRDIGDAIPRLQESETSPLAEFAPSRRSWLPWAMAGLAMAYAASRALLTPAAEPRSVTRLALSLPPGQHLVASFADSFALSPDGSRIVYAAATDSGTGLYLRELDSFESTPIEGTSGATGPFFSPDGGSVGFFAEGEIRRVPLSGGVPTTICDLPSQIVEPHGTWSPRGEIVFSLDRISGLRRVDVATGRTERLTVLDAATNERGHRRPQVLPNGDDVLFTVELESGFRPAVVSLETRERREFEGLGLTGVEVQYVPSGHLLYEQSGALFAVKLDLERLAARGSPVQVVSNVRVSLATEFADVAVSDGGTLAYLSGNADARLVWVDRSGSVTPVLEEKDSYRFPGLSPDGRRVALSTRTGPGLDLWVYELDRGTRTRLTTEGSNWHPEWTSDGKRITFVSTRSGPPALFETAADGSGRAEALAPGEYPRIAPRWSPDGKRLVFIELNPVTSFDILILEKDVVTPWLAGPGSQGIPYFSADGRVLSYTSNESGRIEVYAQPYPGPGERVIVSRDGGMEARWSRDGREIYYRHGDRMYAVAVETEPVLRVGAPQLLFEGRFESTPGGYPNYDVAADGRFLMIQSDTEELTQIHIVTNWFEELKAIDGR